MHLEMNNSNEKSLITMITLNRVKVGKRLICMELSNFIKVLRGNELGFVTLQEILSRLKHLSLKVTAEEIVNTIHANGRVKKSVFFTVIGSYQ